MKQRIKLADRQLPNYSKGEEIFNMVSHIVGAALGIAALVLCIIVSAMHHSGIGVVSSCIYGVTLIVLYTMSSVYHGLRPGMGKKVMQVLDHCTIYFLIAGSYTPILLVPMPCPRNPRVMLTQLYGILRIALQAKPIHIVQTDTGKNLIHDPKDQRGFIEREIFRGMRLTEAVCPDLFYIHSSVRLGQQPDFSPFGKHLRHVLTSRLLVHLNASNKVAVRSSSLISSFPTASFHKKAAVSFSEIILLKSILSIPCDRITCSPQISRSSKPSLILILTHLII